MNRLFLTLATAVKALKASPMLTLLAIGTLAIGIGATTTMFSVADVFLFRPIDFGAHTGRVVCINAIETRKPLDLEDQALSWPELREARTVSSFDRVEERKRYESDLPVHSGDRGAAVDPERVIHTSGDGIGITP